MRELDSILLAAADPFAHLFGSDEYEDMAEEPSVPDGYVSRSREPAYVRLYRETVQGQIDREKAIAGAWPSFDADEILRETR